ncbi:MAG: exodeoxyribonuclease V subunit alpha [Ideonella sp.]|nr:exodeoxyribonuclease V subunit alpha [Ideonella sp.]
MTPSDTSPASGPEHDLAAGFARRIERWSLAGGAAPAAARAAHDAAHALSLATAAGHVCIELRALGDDAPALRDALLASGTVGSAQAPGACPLVLDDDGRLYLQRYFDYERRLAARLVRLAANPERPPLDAPALRASLDARFGSAVAGAEPDWQKLAAALALRGRLTIISGGPGTGKTTTVVALLACLIEQQPGCRIALAAPTGKAAARMTEAIAQRAQLLPPALRSAMPADAATVHRLLEAGPAGFGRHAGRPLAIDVLIVDEASMLDLALATQLLEAVPEAARVVLLGDKDQLAAVESGAVFAELSADPSLSDACRAELAALTGTPAAAIVPPPAARTTALADSTVWLRRNYRFGADSAVARLAEAINAGDGDAALDSAGPLLDGSAATLAHALDGYAPLLKAVLDGAPAEEVHAAFARYRVLAALRDGPRGVAGLNARIEQAVRGALGALDGAPRSPWYPGRPVLVRRNDALLKLFNGDIGIALPTAADGALEVVFQRADGSLRRIAPARVPEHETAFGMTVHKAQGSEFDAVLVVLPEQAASRVLTRELVYTAVTRARSAVTLCAGPVVLAAAVGRTTQRRSGLLARLREQGAAVTPRR